jgi:hypothetical protein
MEAFYFVEPVGTTAPASTLAVTARASVVWTRWRTHGFLA